MTQEMWEAHQRKHGFTPAPQMPVAAPVEPVVPSKAETEAERTIQGDIAQYLNLHDIPHIRPPMNKKSTLPLGWPDISFAYRGIPVAMEVKTDTGKLSPEQATLHPKLAANGWRVLVVRSVADVQALLRGIDQERL